jgi:hypothetical protein
VIATPGWGIYERLSARNTLAVSGGSTDLADFLVFDSPQTFKNSDLLNHPEISFLLAGKMRFQKNKNN